MTLKLARSLRIFTRTISNIGHTIQINPITNEANPKVLQFVIAENTKDVNENVADFVTDIFTKHEPVTIAAGLEREDEFREYILNTVEKGKSLLVTNPKTNKIVSAAVTIVTTPNSARDTRDYANSKVKSKKTRRLIHLFADILESSNLFNCLRTEKLWNIGYLATDVKMAGCGLSEFLMRQCYKLALKEGYPYAYIECTNHYSAKLANKLGYTPLPSRKVQSYTDGLGIPWIFKTPPAPHGDIVVAYAKVLPKTVRPQCTQKKLVVKRKKDPYQNPFDPWL